MKSDTPVWIYNGWNLTLPRACFDTGVKDNMGNHMVRENGYCSYHPSDTLYPTREAAIEARTLIIHRRIKQYQDRITLLQSEILMFTELLPGEATNEVVS